MSCPRALALAVAAAFVTPASGATVARAPGLAAMVSIAPRIVVAETVEVRVDRGRGQERALPVTLVTLRVLETLKGPPALQLALELPGGRLPDDLFEVAGMPRFRAGDRDVLFLHDTPGMLSPILGIFAGRFRVVPGEGSDEREVRSYDGGPLRESFMGGEDDGRASGHGGGVPLSAFRRAVRRHLLQPAAAVLPATLQSAGSMVTPAPDCLVAVLGPAPALADGCRDWTCVAARSTAMARASLPAGGVATVVGEASASACAGPATLSWGTSVHGRPLDALTLAVTVRTEAEGRGETSVVLNASQPWNAWDGASPPEMSGAVDAVAVLAEALTALALPPSPEGGAASPASAHGAGDSKAARSRRPADSARPVGLAANPCDGGTSAIVNPRVLMFDSTDHAKMKRYQVGYFLPHGQQPVTVVNLPMSAFLERRAFDLPPGELNSMKGQLAASITSAGLATPIGHVYIYRVRGVWSDGVTAWSAPSQTFVRCAR